MIVVFLVAAAAGLPVVLWGQRADRVGTDVPLRNWILIRSAGAALLFGGLTGFALSLLTFPAYVSGPVAVLIGTGAAYLRSEIISMTADGPPYEADEPGALEGTMGLVVVPVGVAAAGRIQVVAGGERRYLPARPAGEDEFTEGTRVVVVSFGPDGVARVAAPEDMQA